MDDAVQNYVTSHSVEEGYAGRIDVVTGPSGRRRWPEHVKAEIVLESYRDGVSVADVARKHGVSAPQLHSWRRAARDGVLTMPDDDMLGLVPVVVEAREAIGLAQRAAGLAATTHLRSLRSLKPMTTKESTMTDTMIDLLGVIAKRDDVDFLRDRSLRQARRICSFSSRISWPAPSPASTCGHAQP